MTAIESKTLSGKARSFSSGAAVDDRWLSVAEIADYLGVSKDTVYAWILAKSLPGHKVGRFWKFKKEEIDQWVRSGGVATVLKDGRGRNER